MYLSGKRLLLAGGTGLAGSAVLRRVLAAVPDVRVRVPHRGQRGAFVDDPRVEYVRADLAELRDCSTLLSGCDCAVLAAAETGGARQARDKPWTQVTDNLVMDARLLEALHRAGVRRAVFVGTASAYQDFSGAISEDELDWNQDPPTAHFGIGWAKRAAEKLCAFWHQATGIEILIARLANLYGPHARFDPASSHFVAALIRKAVAADDPFVVWGRPEVARDILYADDFGGAVLAMLEASAIRFDIFNIGSGREITVGEVARLALLHAGHTPAHIVYDSASPTTIGQRSLNCEKAHRLLGWRAEVGHDEGIRLTVQWWRANKDRWKR